ncbi:TadE/TadG family type IV pilus assembly protein [Croceibacterium selenioxidans]|nr:TadE/TadG family type IV pilus assembly protein [Croceibacterium selenioxidans]
MIRFARRLSSDIQGATVVEFAFILPVFAGLLMFLFDTGYYLYARSVLAGEVSAAGRSSTLETATNESVAALDADVTEQVQRLVPHGNLTFTRMAYKSYGRAQAVAEAFTDANENGVCDDNEAFDDANGNGRRDTDSGETGIGGAHDAVIYSASLSYNRLFPLAGLLGWEPEATVTAKTILRNQPFASQVQPVLGHCP